MKVASWSVAPWLDYGHVLLEPTPWSGDVYPESHGWAGNPVAEALDDNVEVLHRAFTSGIAQGRYLTVFLTPHQSNYPLPVTVELWDGRPPDDLAAWPEVFEATITSGAEGLLWSSPTLEGVVIPVPAGTYRALIAGRDFTRTIVDSTSHPDSYRVQLWLSDGQIEPRRLSAWTHAADCRCV